MREVQVHPREHDLVIATHGRGIWIVDDITPLRALSSDLLAREAAFVPGRPVQQRLSGRGGWVEGDAAFVGENPAGGAVITYYQRTRHLFGPIKLEVLDASGKLVETISATKRRGLNRVSWSMQVSAAARAARRLARLQRLAGPACRARGRTPCGSPRAREVIETKLAVGLDRRATYGVAERQEQFDAAMRVHALFERMSGVVDRIDGARAKAAPPLAARLDELKKKIVATKEGGAITGEERLREHADALYGAILSWEGQAGPLPAGADRHARARARGRRAGSRRDPGGPAAAPAGEGALAAGCLDGR